MTSLLKEGRVRNAPSRSRIHTGAGKFDGPGSRWSSRVITRGARSFWDMEHQASSIKEGVNMLAKAFDWRVAQDSSVAEVHLRRTLPWQSHSCLSSREIGHQGARKGACF